MKNVKSLIILFFIFALFEIPFGYSVTHTWLGGDDTWDTPSEWDTGTIPTEQDEVIIPSGTVRIYYGYTGVAKSMHIHNGANLRIYTSGILKVSDAVNTNALHNEGRVYNFGEIYITNVSRTSQSDVAKGIHNTNFFYSAPDSYISITSVDNDAIYNGTSSYFYARGTIDIKDTGSLGIYNRQRFGNTGTINIDANNTAPNAGIVNHHDFRNYAGGVINIVGGGNAAFANNDLTTTSNHLRNYGTINLSNSAHFGFYNSGIVTNYEGGIIISRSNDAHNLHNRQNGEINNYGTMQLLYGNREGIFNMGEIDNSGYITVLLSDSYAYRGYAGSIMNNSGFMSISADNTSDMYIEGSIENDDEGVIFISNRLFIFNGSFINEGFLASENEGNNHWINAGSTFINYGAIEDHHDRFLSPNFNNQQVFVKPITGTMQTGIPYPNALEVASLSNVTIGNWYVSNSPGSPIAGTYNASTNTFTPNSNAIGLSELYISVTINSSGFQRFVKINLEGSVSAKKSNPSNVASSSKLPQSLKSTMPIDQQITAFPNPTNGFLQLTSSAFADQATSISVYDPMGRMVHQQPISEGSQSVNIHLPNNLSSGIYFVRLMQQGNELAVKRIQFVGK